MVLWKNLRGIARRFYGNADNNSVESPQVLNVKSLEQEKVLKGFKPDVAAGLQRPKRDHIRLRGVG